MSGQILSMLERFLTFWASMSGLQKMIFVMLLAIIPVRYFHQTLWWLALPRLDQVKLTYVNPILGLKILINKFLKLQKLSILLIFLFLRLLIFFLGFLLFHYFLRFDLFSTPLFDSLCAKLTVTQFFLIIRFFRLIFRGLKQPLLQRTLSVIIIIALVIWNIESCFLVILGILIIN